ncbi:MAG TPA: IPT/TIG domain-containing protein [Vicinamibacterales bacterium]
MLEPLHHPFHRRTFLRLLAAFIAGASACGGKSPTTPSAPPPPSTNVTLSSISPTQGSTTGGNNVTVIGANFASDTTVLVGGIVATNVVVQSSTGLTAVVGANAAAGPADVVVMSGGHSATLSRAFTFVAPTGNNHPPVVGSIRSVNSRPGAPTGFADINDTITLTADATDAETPLSGLTFLWTGPGTFGGTTATTSWHLPASVLPAPSPVTVTVTAVETYTEGKVTHTQASEPKSLVMQVHDSQKEILDMGEDFLTLFSNSSIPTDQVLHNFSTSCQGRSTEANDTNRARASYVQDFAKFRITRLTPVIIAFGSQCQVTGKADACSAFTVHWEITYLKADSDGHYVGEHETTDGTDYVSAVLENNQWRLCASNFSGRSTNPLTGVTRLVSW